MKTDALSFIMNFRYGHGEINRCMSSSYDLDMRTCSLNFAAQAAASTQSTTKRKTNLSK